MNQQASARPAAAGRGTATRKARNGRGRAGALAAVRGTGQRRPGANGAARPATAGGASARRSAAGAPRRAKTAGSARGVARGETPKARGERTRQRVAEALLELLEEGDAPPTAKAVAERASVSVRLVFHHFEDMDALYRMVANLQFDRHWATVREVPPDLPFATRVDRTVTQRARLFESISPVRRSGLALTARSEAVARAVDRSDNQLRSWLETTFQPELRAAGRSRRELLAAIDAATSWETWERMRRGSRLSAAAARRAMERTLGLLLRG
jgi:TetR/AcrR family transcriptional regulator of autoinduction and epiphytic fitness